MFYVVARIELLVPQSQSLKEKRAVIRRLKDRLSDRFGASVAEVEFQDLWQRAALGMALVVSSPSRGRDAVAAMRRFVEEDPRVVVVDQLQRVGRLQGA